MANGDYSSVQIPASPYPEAVSGESPYSPSPPATGYGDPVQSKPAPDGTPGDGADLRPNFGNGVNLQPAYTANGNADLGWGIMKPLTAIKTVRFEIEESAVEAAKRWIREAIANGYRVIATYHSFDAINNKPASDDPKHMQQAIAFWTTYYKPLAASGPFVINIMNEWGHKSIKAQQFADQYNLAISAIRVFYAGPLIIDLPGSGQIASVAAAAVKGLGSGGSQIQDTNIILSAHIYPNAWNGTGPMQMADLDLLASTNRPCMIGEFGENNLSSATDWRALVTYAKSLHWPVLAWAWDGDGEIMNILWPEFQPFVPGVPNSVYKLNEPYASTVLPFL